MKKLIFFILLSLLTLVGCEGEHNYERTIWVNPDVECCGVKDPLNNLEWLNDWYGYYGYSYFNREEINYPTYQIVYLFSNDSTLENFFVIKTSNSNFDNYFNLFTCDGNLVDEGEYVNFDLDYTNPDILYQKSQISIPKCQLCDDFFENHILVDTIAYLHVK